MVIKSLALSLTVQDVSASSDFLKRHFGFTERFSTGDVAYLIHEGMESPIVFMRSGMDTLPEVIRNQKASGIIVAFTVDDIEAELERLQAEGVTLIAPLQEDPWGERLFEVADPNGVTYQIVQWVTPSDAQYEGNNPGQW